MPSDIHALEIEFAKNPTLDACIPLCDAYLAAKRYMEAMVVCKKGIKNAPPGDARGRVLLARVYLEQGKPPKAEQEIVQVLADFAGNALALEMQGRIFFEQGKRTEAVAPLQQALAADPTLVKARAWLTEMGIAAGATAAPPAATPAPAAGAPKPAPAPAAAPPAGARPGAAPVAAPARPAGSAPPPAVAGRVPVTAHAAPPPVGGAPAAAPPAAAAHAASPAGHAAPADSAPAKPLEHVGDFFAPDALGFSGDSSGIETAGPGRLTILGFVPKNTGSIKTTIFVILGIIAVAFAAVAYFTVNAKNQTQIAELFRKVRSALDDDRYGRYKEVLSIGEKILHVDENHVLTLSAMAYAEAVLATDHREAGALEKAQSYLDHAMKAPKEENEFRVASRALVAYATKNYDAGLTDIQAVLDKGGSSPLVELEAFRLKDAVHPDAPETKVEMRRLVQTVVSTARAFNYLGWYYYRLEDWNKAGKYFDNALQNAKGHPMAMLGRSLVALDQGVGLEQKQKDIEKDLKEVFAIPPDEMSPPVQALALFTRAQLRRWQNDNVHADEDFQAALKLDPNNPMFFYRRGLSLLKLGSYTEAIDLLRKVVGVDPNNPKYLKKLAEAQLKAKIFPDAKASLDKMAQLDPKDVDVKLLYANFYMEQKQYDKAVESFGAITRDDGGEPFTLAQVGISSALRETDKARAVKHMEDFLGKVPDSTSPETMARLWCELGQDYEATKNKAKAIQSYQVGIEQYRYYPDCHFFLCRVNAFKGPEAKESCHTYVTLDPRGRYAAEAQKHTK